MCIREKLVTELGWVTPSLMKTCCKSVYSFITPSAS